ncbi:diphosphoinositol polyphosphate phosphohydrolase 2 isoform X2 [Myotis lucifugus]|uniref:diphosphoinositol polyphosphate phosphohydrolase 2 isoform X2 n=2 Tax=Myotis TaxID=9434 RepID=UPI0003C43B59|nr:diphosphoinositol polyphosphate phosphohydrolase 2 isoform X2 [Myotis lucifugus]
MWNNARRERDWWWAKLPFSRQSLALGILINAFLLCCVWFDIWRGAVFLFLRVLLVSSSRYPDQWIVPGGGMEPEEEPGGAAVREVYEEAGVKGKLGRLLGIFENQDRKHRTYVYVLIVTEILEDWEDSVNIGRKREWFKVEDAIKVLQCHKPVHAEYLEKLKLGCSPSNGNSTVPSLPDNNTLFVTAAQTSGLPSTIR